MPSTPPHLATPTLTPATADDATAFLAATGLGFQEEMSAGWEALTAEVAEWDRSFGFKVGSRWVSTCGAFSRQLTLPGGASIPVAAVTDVTVQAPYRRRGLLRQMMQHQLTDVHQRGESVAILYASEAGIYGRFGYGNAAPRAQLSGQNRSIQFLPHIDLGAGSVDDVSLEDFMAAAPGLWDELAPLTPGTLNRRDVHWRAALFDDEPSRGGATPLRYLLHYDAKGKPTGFATYRFKAEYTATGPNGEVRIGQLQATTAPARAQLWRYLLDLDLARTFSLRGVAPDDPIHHLVVDPRAIKTAVSDGLHLRIIDATKALAQREYAAPLDLVIEVTDGYFAHNTARFQIQTDGIGSPATVRKVRRKPDLSLGVLELGASYLGGTSIASLYAAGRITEHTPDAVALASAAFRSTRLPACPDHF